MLIIRDRLRAGPNGFAKKLCDLGLAVSKKTEKISKRFIKELEKIRRQGYAPDNE
jgi:hypothetical protein